MQANKENHEAYNNRLQPAANHLRNNATLAEIHLWKHVLRAGQMKGYTFRRQRPVLNYIADFMCQPLKLIIEVDGSIHNDETVSVKDHTRQLVLEAAGFSVLRFSNQAVLYQTSLVRANIESWIAHHESQQALPAHSPSPPPS